MEEYARKLILAGEISGFLHDLGKLHPGFPGENLKGGINLSNLVKERTGIGAAHGAILEPGRVYPDTGELADHPELSECLERLLNHPAWAEVLRLPEEWTQPGTVQVTGLGAPLRQHHAANDWPDKDASLLGDLYAMGADIRDSALDKGSSGALYGEQAPSHASIADSLGGCQQPYNPDTLRELWARAPAALEILWQDGAWRDIPVTRQVL